MINVLFNLNNNFVTLSNLTDQVHLMNIVTCEWSPEGLYDKSVSLIPNSDEI